MKKPKKYRIDYEDKGYIEYFLIEDSITLAGSYVNPQFRRQGVFSLLFYSFCNMFWDYPIYASVAEPCIIPLFEETGFTKYDGEIPYWGKPENCILMRRMSLKGLEHTWMDKAADSDNKPLSEEQVKKIAKEIKKENEPYSKSFGRRSGISLK